MKIYQTQRGIISSLFYGQINELERKIKRLKKKAGQSPYQRKVLA